MPLNDDPAKWIVVALFACIHLTVCGWRRSRTPFAWNNLLPGLGVLGLSGCCCFPIADFSVAGGATDPSSSFLRAAIPIASGLVLSSRAPSFSLRATSAMIGVSVSLTLTWFFDNFLAQGTYIGHSPTWADRSGIDEVVGRLPYQSAKFVTPQGYIETVHVGDGPVSRKVGSFELDFPVPLWHSPITGLYGKRPGVYRLWTPKNLRRSAEGILLVPEGTPPGQEPTSGIPTDRYRQINLWERSHPFYRWID